MSLLKAVLLIALLPALVAGCGPSQGPFANDRSRSRFLLAPLPDAGGIAIGKVSGVSDVQSHALRTALVEEFARQDIAAAMTDKNPASPPTSPYVEGVGKIGTAPGGPQRVQVDWTLYDRQAKVLATSASSTIFPAAVWQAPDPGALTALVEDAVARFTASLVEPAYGPTATREETREKRRDAVQRPAVPIHIWPITGPLDQANILLRAAMARALIRRDIAVVNQMEQAKLILSGELSLGPAQNGNRPIEIIWTMLLPDGKELGRLNQKNAVSEETLKSGWDALSRSIAGAAAGGVGELIRRLPAEALNEGR